MGYETEIYHVLLERFKVFVKIDLLSQREKKLHAV